MRDEIQVISRQYANRILDGAFSGGGGTYEPRGLYLVVEDDCHGTIWTAIDNLSGEAWTEEFDTKRKAVRWLHGLPSTDRFGRRLR